MATVVGTGAGHTQNGTTLGTHQNLKTGWILTVLVVAAVVMISQ